MFRGLRCNEKLATIIESDALWSQVKLSVAYTSIQGMIWTCLASGARSAISCLPMNGCRQIFFAKILWKLNIFGMAPSSRQPRLTGSPSCVNRQPRFSLLLSESWGYLPLSKSLRWRLPVSINFLYWVATIVWRCILGIAPLSLTRISKSTHRWGRKGLLHQSSRSSPQL